jgi:F-type H+-transporting ATPase subunit a
MADPLHQFVVKPILFPEVSIAGYDVSFTNSSLMMMIAVFLSITFFSLSMRRKALVPSRFQVMAEMCYEFIANMIRETMGSKGRIYFPIVFTVFMIVFWGNMLGMMPYAFTFTSHIVVNFALAMMIFFLVIIIGIIRNGTKFFTLFCPPGLPLYLMPLVIPLELISFLSRPITLSVRLFLNMMVGHLILKIFAGFSASMAAAGAAWIVAAFFPAVFVSLLIAFEFLVAFVQAYVFTILTCIYLKDTVDLHH